MTFGHVARRDVAQASRHRHRLAVRDTPLPCIGAAARGEERGAYRARMRDDKRARRGASERAASAAEKLSHALSTVRACTKQIVGPGVEFMAGEMSPGQALPRAEVDLAPGGLDCHGDAEVGLEQPRKRMAAAERTGDDARGAIQSAGDGPGARGEPGAGREIGTAIADAFAPRRWQVAEKDQIHASTPR